MPTQVIKKNGVVYETQLFLSADNCVYVVADGVKTYATLLNELFALVDMSRVTRNSCVIEAGESIYRIDDTDFSTRMRFTTALSTFSSPNYYLSTMNVKASDSNWSVTAGSVVNKGNMVPTSGTTISLYYNIVVSGQGMETSAQDVSYGSSNVKVALDALNGYKKGTVELNGVWSSGSWYGIYFAVIPFRNADKATISITTVNTLVNQTLTPTLVSIENQKEDYITIKSETAGIGGYPFALTISVS